jgi:hypothetical protein
MPTYTDDELRDILREAAGDADVITQGRYNGFRESQKQLGRDLPATGTFNQRFGNWMRAEAEAGLGDLRTNPIVPWMEMQEALSEPVAAWGVDPRALQALSERMQNDTAGTLYRAATCGIVVSQWRDAIEPLHFLVSHAEMAFISIATCEALLPVVSRTTHLNTALDWEPIATVLTDDHRRILGGRTTSELFGEHWEDVKAEVRRRCQHEGDADTLGKFVLWCCRVCPEWYGAPLWEGLVNRFVDYVVEAELPLEMPASTLRFQLLFTPLSLSVETFEWCIRNGLSCIHSGDHYVGRGGSDSLNDR